MLPALGLKLGSQPHLHGALKLDCYIDTAVQVPDTVATPNQNGYAWGMLGNDRVGCCMIAAMLHADETLYLKRGRIPWPYGETQCLDLYGHITGYNRADPSTDQGTDPSEAMRWWATNGLPGHNLDGWGFLPGDSPNIKRAIWEFGVVIYSVALPTGAQQQGVHWRGGDLGAAGSWGGHAVVGNSYTPDLWGTVTWGQEGDMDDAFRAAYLEQVFVPLSRDSLRGDVGPGGFNFAQMRRDLPDPWNRG